MTHAFRFHQTGGPEVLKWEDVPLGKPGPGEARCAIPRSGSTSSTSTAAPASIRRRPSPAGSASKARAWSKKSEPGSTISSPASASPMAPGPSAPMPRRGTSRRTGWCRCPKGISDQQAAAMMLKGMTAQYLMRRTYKVKTGRHHPVPRRGRRRRPDRLPMGQGARRHRHRHGRQRREGRARQGAWLRLTRSSTPARIS